MHEAEIHTLKSLRWRLWNAVEALATRPATESLPERLAATFCTHLLDIKAEMFPDDLRSEFESLFSLMTSEPEGFEGEGRVRAIVLEKMRMSKYRIARKTAARICSLSVKVTMRTEDLMTDRAARGAW